MLTLWERMAEMFPYTWTSALGDTDGSAFKTWTRGLLDLSESQIKAGVFACSKLAEKFPPSLGLFRELCLGAPRTDRPESESRRLPRPHSDPERLRQVRAFEEDRQRRIFLTPKWRREPHEDDVETFRESWDNLGLSKRFGPCAYD